MAKNEILYAVVNGEQYKLVHDAILGVNKDGKIVPIDAVAHDELDYHANEKFNLYKLTEDEANAIRIAITHELESLANDETKTEFVKLLVRALYKSVEYAI